MPKEHPLSFEEIWPKTASCCTSICMFLWIRFATFLLNFSRFRTESTMYKPDRYKGQRSFKGLEQPDYFGLWSALNADVLKKIGLCVERWRWEENHPFLNLFSNILWHEKSKTGTVLHNLRKENKAVFLSSQAFLSSVCPSLQHRERNPVHQGPTVTTGDQGSKKKAHGGWGEKQSVHQANWFSHCSQMDR